MLFVVRILKIGAVVVLVVIVEGIIQVELGNIQTDEFDIGVGVLALCNGACECKAGHYDDIEAFCNSLLDHLNTGSGAVCGGLVVLELDRILVAESLASFVGGLVEGLVGYVAVVGDHCYFISSGVGLVRLFGLVVAAACAESKDHSKSEDDCEKSFHDFSSVFFKFVRTNLGDMLFISSYRGYYTIVVPNRQALFVILAKKA
ncbi:unknown [Firmicutes bacterium CAG:555]|nr:unknown [Firmicutes bacterium CAG:555]